MPVVRIGSNLINTACMKYCIRIAGNIFSATGTGISHDGRTTARLVSGSRIAITVTTATGGTVKSMIGTELMTEFVRDKIDIERITYRLWQNLFHPALYMLLSQASAESQASPPPPVSNTWPTS